jgi:antitoxin component of MazEF toxin-antitoxin module
MPAVSKRKVLKVGGSRTVALPPQWLDAFNLTIGNEVEVVYDSIVLIRPAGMKLDHILLKKEIELLATLEEAKNEK